MKEKGSMKDRTNLISWISSEFHYFDTPAWLTSTAQAQWWKGYTMCRFAEYLAIQDNVNNYSKSYIQIRAIVTEWRVAVHNLPTRVQCKLNWERDSFVSCSESPFIWRLLKCRMKLCAVGSGLNIRRSLDVKTNDALHGG
jgi:hypothetical protein